MFSGGLVHNWRTVDSFQSETDKILRVIACNSGTQMRVRDSSPTQIFFLKNRMMQHRAQNIIIKF